MGVAGYAYYENIERADPKYAFLTGVFAVSTGSSVLKSAGSLCSTMRAGRADTNCFAKARYFKQASLLRGLANAAAHTGWLRGSQFLQHAPEGQIG